MNAGGARLLRVGENAAVVFPFAGVLAKVAAGPQAAESVRHELAVAQWLASVDVPVVRSMVDKPLVIDGYAVALWEHLPDARSADLLTLAQALRRLHAVTVPDPPPLPPVAPFARLDDRLSLAATITNGDRAFLTELRDQLAEGWQQTEFDLPTAVLHGDAHMDNLLVTGDGRPAFVDLEHVSIGPPEWDLTLTALYYECGWFSAEQYHNFAKAYGFDVRTSRAWPVLRRIRMLRMTTWLTQTAADYPERQAQLRHRLMSLRDGSAPTGWTGF
jgi:aminoglycoside phosphotransferase (APT) family kinase protein